MYLSDSWIQQQKSIQYENRQKKVEDLNSYFTKEDRQTAMKPMETSWTLLAILGIATIGDEKRTHKRDKEGTGKGSIRCVLEKPNAIHV